MFNNNKISKNKVNGTINLLYINGIIRFIQNLVEPKFYIIEDVACNVFNQFLGKNCFIRQKYPDSEFGNL